jgi:hypothetical protein
VDSLTPPSDDTTWPARPPARSSAAIAIALVIAVALIVGGTSVVALAHSSSTSSNTSVGPFVRDPNLSPTDRRNLNSHWHAALGVYDCDHWMGDRNGSGVWQWPAALDVGFGGMSPGRVGTKLYAGLHSHDDGVIHMEPARADEAGTNATLGRYFEFGGWGLSANGYDFLGTKATNGDSCGSQPGKLQWAVAKFNGDLQRPQDYVVKTGNPADYKLYNDDIVVVAFLPEGKSITELGNPPSAPNLPDAANNAGPGQ